VFITAYGDEDIGPRVLSEGAVACLLKPFSEDALLTAIRAALLPTQ
jgi:FixJ family two-component response regulator